MPTTAPAFRREAHLGPFGIGLAGLLFVYTGCGDDAGSAADAASSEPDGGTEGCEPGPARCVGDVAVSCERGSERRTDCLKSDQICLDGKGCSDVTLTRDGGLDASSTGGPLDAGPDAAWTEPTAVGQGSCKLLHIVSTMGRSQVIRISDVLDDVQYDDYLTVGIGDMMSLPAPGVFSLTAMGAPVAVSIWQDVSYIDSGPSFDYKVESGYAVLNEVVSRGETRGTVKDVRIRRCENIYKPYPPGGEAPAGSPGILIGCEPAASTPCLYLASYSWDSAAEQGSPCDNSGECGDPGKRYCDPLSKTCRNSECDETKVCAAGLSCSAYGTGPGRCAKACAPRVGADTCPTGEECMVRGADPNMGMCVPRGSAVLAGVCSAPDPFLNTGCSASDNLCSPDGHCRQTCNLFSEATAPATCPVGTRCGAGNGGTYCRPTTDADSAAVGAQCDNGGASCGPVTGRYNGLCDFDNSVSQNKCLALCSKKSTTCAMGTCKLWDGYYGDCQP